MDTFRWKRIQEIQAADRGVSRSTLSVVLSFRNEEDVLDELLRRLRSVLTAEVEAGRLSDYEFVFVNDDSTDRSREILEREAAIHPDIRLITMSRCFGVSPCALAGIEFSSGDAVVYMDADLQDPPEVIPRMIEAWQERKTDVVHTVRESRSGEWKGKLLITRIGYQVIRMVSDIQLQIEAGDFKLLSRRAADHLVRLREKRPYLRGLVSWIGFNQQTIRYHREARAAGETKFPVLSSSVLRNFLSSALISFSDVPLQFALVAGVVVSLLSLVVLFYMSLTSMSSVQGGVWSTATVLIIFLSGFHLLTTGILGLYVNSIYLETKRRPNYIVESCMGFEHHLRRAGDDSEATAASFRAGPLGGHESD